MPGPGERIDRFVIERLLGRGGMAEVYAARDTQLRRLVALKRLRSDRDDSAATARLIREARAAASFQHPGAVIVYDVFEHEGAAYMAMELVSGRALRSYIGDGSIPIEKRLRWLVDIARALGAAHHAGLVHRDVKPHNVMVRDDGAIKVLDFGIARTHHRSPASEDTSQTLGTLSETGAVIGTPLYASPEQLSAAKVDGRSDQFAWGVMAYELCCGLLPWRRRDTLTMLAQLVSGDLPTMLQRIADATAAHNEAAAQGLTTRSAPPPPDPALYASIPEEIEPVLRRAMSRDPDDRFPTIDDAADLLEEHAEAPPSMRYIPRSALPSSDSLIDLGRSGSTPAVREEPTSSGTSAPSLRRTVSSTFRAGSGTPPPGAARAKAPSSLPPPNNAEGLDDIEDPRSVTPTAASAAAAPVSMFPISDASTTGGRIATGGTTADTAQAPVAPPEEKGDDAPALFRRKTMIAASVAMVVASVAIGVATSWNDRHRNEAVAAPPAPAARPSVTRVACAPAEVRGAFSFADAPSLLGQAACLRLAIAAGVPWDPPRSAAPSGSALAVVAEGGTTTKITLTIAGLTASAEAPHALEAVDAAARSLAEKLAAPSVRPERQTELGETGDAAVRLEALLRRRAARLGDDPADELSSALSVAPRSPWPRLLALPDATTAQAQKLRDEALAHVGSLPDALAEATRGSVWLHTAKTDAEREGAMPALRRAYAARPNEGFVARAMGEALLAAGLYEEAAAVGQRIADHAPSESLLPLSLLVQHAAPDPTWIDLRGRLLDRLEALLPEARGWDTRAMHEALAGRPEEARKSLALGEALGLPSAQSRMWARDLTKAAVEIAGDKPAAARTLVQPFLGSPSPPEAALATRLLVLTHLLEGHAAEAEIALSRDIARLDALGDRSRAAELWITLLGLHRRLEKEPSDFVSIPKLEALALELEAKESPLAPPLRAEIFLAALARKEKKPSDATAAQRQIETYARKVARGDRSRQDDLSVAALPLALASTGPEAMRELWASLDRARPSSKLPYLLLFGKAAEKVGADDEAERAYRTVASSPLSAFGLDHLSAHIRLTRLLERLGRKGEAEKERASTDRILATADKGIAEALGRPL